MSGRVRTGLDPKTCRRYELDIVGRGLCGLFFPVVFVEQDGRISVLHETEGYERAVDMIEEERRTIDAGITACEAIEAACILAGKIIASKDIYIDTGSFVISKDTLWVRKEKDRRSGVLTIDVRLVWIPRDKQDRSMHEHDADTDPCKGRVASQSGQSMSRAGSEGEKYVKRAMASYLEYCIGHMAERNSVPDEEQGFDDRTCAGTGMSEGALEKALEIVSRERSSLRMIAHRLHELRKELMLTGSRLSTGRSGPHKLREPVKNQSRREHE